jgi:dethiobiotin synthetase
MEKSKVSVLVVENAGGVAVAVVDSLRYMFYYDVMELHTK